MRRILFLFCQSIYCSGNQTLTISKQHSRGDFVVFLLKTVLKLYERVSLLIGIGGTSIIKDRLYVEAPRFFFRLVIYTTAGFVKAKGYRKGRKNRPLVWPFIKFRSGIFLTGRCVGYLGNFKIVDLGIFLDFLVELSNDKISEVEWDSKKGIGGFAFLAWERPMNKARRVFFWYLLVQFWHLSPILPSIQTHLYPVPSMQETWQDPSFIQGDDEQASGTWNFDEKSFQWLKRLKLLIID